MTNNENDRSPTMSIVVGTDFSESSERALVAAAGLARRVPGSALHLVHVVDGEPSEARERDLIKQLGFYLNEKAHVMGELRGITVGIHVRSGEPVREIAQLAIDVGADLIITGSCAVLAAGPRARVQTDGRPYSDCAAARSRTLGSIGRWHDEHADRGRGFSYERELPPEAYDSEVIPPVIFAASAR
jgi:hypothetical protein